MKHIIATIILATLGLASCTSKPKPQEETAFGKESIRRAIRDGLPKVKTCYENLLAAPEGTKRTGKIAVVWEINPSGEANNISFKIDELNDEKMQACLTEAIKKMKFPHPPEGQTAVIDSYPFYFKDSQVEAK